MKKIAIVLVVFMFCLTGKVFAGGVYIDFVIPNQKTRVFADEFMSEMQKKKIQVSFFTGDYFVRGYFGGILNKKTGEVKSAIGIFVSEKKDFKRKEDSIEEEQEVFKIWFDELFSRTEIRKRAREAAEYIFQYLKMMDEERKNSIKIPV